MANLPKGGCVTQVSIMRDVWDPLGLHLNQKDLKSGKKWPSYGQFTKGRFRDSCEYHARCKRSIRLHLNQTDLKLGRKWPSYGQLTHGRLREQYWD